jgi:hypothetical protein
VAGAPFRHPGGPRAADIRIDVENRYGSSNILIGQPLAYQYLTSIRADALPATPDDLLRMRGRGWLSNFPSATPTPGPGLPLVNTSRWDTGVQAHGVTG